MTDTATPETGPVDAPATLDSVMAEFEAGGEAPDDAVESVVQELVNEAEGKGDSEQEPATEDDATEAAETDAEEPEDGNPDDEESQIDREEGRYKVKVNGEIQEVSLAELKNGYSRTEDYKAKTMAVADERRALEAERSKVETSVQAEYANRLEEATNLMAKFDPVLAEARKIDWNALKQADPAAFVQAQDAVNARLNAIQQMNEQVAQTRAQSQAAQAQQAEQERAQRFDTAANKIVEVMPELADEAKFKDFASGAIEFLRKDVGFSQEEIAEALDDRVLMLANDARQWRAHKAAMQQLPPKKIVPKSAVKAMTTDGSGSRASTPRFPTRAGRDAKADWVAQAILSEE